MPFPSLKDIYGFFAKAAKETVAAVKGAPKRASLGHVTQLVLAGLFACFAALGEGSHADKVKAKKALIGLFTVFSLLQSYGCIGKLKVSIAEKNILDSIKSSLGLAAAAASIEVVSNHTMLDTTIGFFDKKIPAYTFCTAFSGDGLIDVGVGIYELVQKHYAAAARSLAFGALEGVEAYEGVWKGIIGEDTTGAILGAVAEFTKCLLSLSGQAPGKPITAEKLEELIKKSLENTQALQKQLDNLPKEEKIDVKGEKTALLGV